MTKLITVYTPTYNRAELLPNLYNSLCNQTCKNFVWMVIDDGSIDNTREIVERFKKERKIDIIYYYKQNGGVHTARDFAYEKANTELIFGIDSDDELIYNSVECISNIWSIIQDKQVAGIIMPVMSNDRKRIGTDFPNISYATYQEFTFKYKFRGDKQTILRTDIIKGIKKAPSYADEKLVGETYKWIQLPNNIPFFILDKFCTIHNYENDGYSKNARKNWFKNLNGFRAEYKQHIECAKYIKPIIKGNIGYIMTSLFLHDYKFLRNSPKKFQTLLFMPLGILGYCYALIKWKKYM